jgi:2-keto-4-pentenoate hydratase/2-oxohepta-3-ene-1,7-dioic acid hydratase in catechol pathway
MRLVTYRNPQGQLRAGIERGKQVIDLAGSDPTLPDSVLALLAAGPEALGRAASLADSPRAVLADDPVLQAPLPRPNKILCIGLNYRDHAEETGAKIPDDPVVFSKFATAVVGPEAEIRLPRVSTKVDFEAELVVVIGRGGRHISEADAIEHVAGYTCGHDVSARDWQLEKDGRQWLLGKTFDTFAPMGPALVTRDEVPDPHALAIRLRLNGRTMQDSTTSKLIFSVPKLIAYISQVVTLEPGDVIFTGTPPGVGNARKPPVYMQPGDVVEVEIDGLGLLRNRCVAES